MKTSALPSLAALLLPVLLFSAGCRRDEPAPFQGYLEAEYIHVAPSLAGRLDALAVAPGARVESGAPLFTLEHAAELASLDEAAARLRTAEARLADLRLGQRPSELAALEARLAQARAAADLSGIELARQQRLLDTRVAAQAEFDAARLSHERNLRALDELAAQIETARLGGRPDAVAAARAEVAVAAAAVERARWSVAQKTVAAPAAALVHDTLFRPGEFVPAGRPVVVLLPPANLKVRFFVPEAALANLRPGDRVNVALTGGAGPLAATIVHVSPKPEYTPPVLYNRDNRAKLVFMVEAAFDAAANGDVAPLHPGRPVDVTLAAP